MCSLERGIDGTFGFKLDRSEPGSISFVARGKKAEMRKYSTDLKILEIGDILFSINKRHVLRETTDVINQLIENSGSSVDIGVVKNKNFGTGEGKS